MSEKSRFRAVEGLWTPWGKVLCWSCHGPKMQGREGPSPERFEQLKTPRGAEYGEHPAHCDQCKTPVWLREESVAALQAIVAAVGFGVLEQTGGMCVAARFPLALGDFVVVTDDDEVGALYTASHFGDEASFERCESLGEVSRAPVHAVVSFVKSKRCPV